MHGVVTHVVPEERDMAVLFVDLKGSSRMVATTEPDDLAARLDPWFQEVCSIVRGYGGTVEGRPGDCVVACWSEPDDLYKVERALLAASRANARTRELGLHTHIGLHADRGQYVRERAPLTDLPSVFGQPSWIAARAQAKDPDGRIVATKDAVSGLRISADWQPHPDRELLALDRSYELVCFEGISTAATPVQQALHHCLEAQFEHKLGRSIVVQEHSELGLAALHADRTAQAHVHEPVLIELLVDALLQQGHIARARDVVQRAQARSSQSALAVKIRLQFFLAQILHLLNDSAGAAREFRTLQSLLTTRTPSRALADCLLYFGINMRAVGSIETGNALVERARDTYEQVIANPVEDRNDAALARLDVALIYHERNEWRPCLGHLRHALQYFLETGHKRHLGTTLNGLGNVAMGRHAFSDAEAYYRRAFWIAREIHDVALEQLAVGNIQKLRQNRSRVPEFTLLAVPDNYKLDADIPPETFDAFELGLWWHVRGRAHEERGDLVRAARCFRLAVEHKRSVAAEASVGNSLHMLGVMCAKQRDWVNAKRFMLESLWIDAEETDIRGLRHSLYDLGTLLTNSGDEDGERFKAAEVLLGQCQRSMDIESREKVLATIGNARASRLRVHITAALETAFQRWTLLNEYGLLRM